MAMSSSISSSSPVFFFIIIPSLQRRPDPCLPLYHLHTRLHLSSSSLFSSSWIDNRSTSSWWLFGHCPQKAVHCYSGHKWTGETRPRVGTLSTPWFDPIHEPWQVLGDQHRVCWNTLYIKGMLIIEGLLMKGDIQVSLCNEHKREW